MNRVRSLLSTRGMLLPLARLRPSVYRKCLHSAKPVWREGTRLSSQRAGLWPSLYQIAGTRTRINLFDKRSIQSRSLSCGDFKGLTPFRKGLLFSSSLKKTKGGGSTRRVILPLLEEVFFFLAKTFVPCMYLVIVFLASFLLLRSV